MRKQIGTFVGAFLLTTSMAQAIEVYSDEVNSFDLAGGLSIYYISGENDYSEVNDGFSRFNFNFNRNLGDGWNAFSHLEWGIQVSSTGHHYEVGNDGLSSTGPTSDTMWLHKGYVGVNHKTYGQFTIGKQWGVSYDVGGATDWFEVFGGDAQGTYNFDTDGGFTGTGRAEQAIQYRISFDKLTLSAQFMATDEVLDFKIDNNNGIAPPVFKGTLNIDESHGVSVKYEAPFDINFGIAYNKAKLKIGDENGNELSVDDELTGAFLTYRNFGEPGLYVGLALTNMKNHDFDDQKQVMEEANGIELISIYRFNNPFAVVGGFISLDDVTKATITSRTNGKFKNEYFILSARYFWDENFYIYLEQKIDNSVSSDPGVLPVPGNATALGMRFDF
ncbi:MAG: porin [Colwellia sp.]